MRVAASAGIVGLAMLAGGCRQMLGIDDPTLEQVADAPLGLDGLGSAIDAPAGPDGHPIQDGTCMERWAQGPIFKSVTHLTELDGDNLDSPFLLSDEKTIYYVRNNDLFRATRSSVTEPFDNPAPVAGLSSPSQEGKAFVLDNETRAFFASARSGTSGGLDLWRGVSNGQSGGSYNVDRSFIGSVDDSGVQADPHMSEDLLHLYYTQGTQIVFSSRGNINANFAPGSPLQNITSIFASDSGPTLTPDETLLVFATTRDNSLDLYYSTRATAKDDFAAPLNIPTIDTGSTERSPHVSSDGCRVYFVSDRDGKPAIFVASLL